MWSWPEDKEGYKRIPYGLWMFLDILGHVIMEDPRSWRPCGRYAEDRQGSWFQGTPDRSFVRLILSYAVATGIVFSIGLRESCGAVWRCSKLIIEYRVISRQIFAVVACRCYILLPQNCSFRVWKSLAFRVYQSKMTVWYRLVQRCG